VAQAPQLLSAALRVATSRHWLGSVKAVVALSQSLAQGVWRSAHTASAREADIKAAQKSLLKAAQVALPSCAVEASAEVEDEEQVSQNG
jgi:hypothetical protein